MIVLKFGGTSVRNIEWIDKALDIAEKELSRAPVIVASAMGKTTDRLQEIASLAATNPGQHDPVAGTFARYTKLLAELKTYHVNEAQKGLTGSNKVECLEIIDEYFNSLQSILKGLNLLKEKTARSNDAIFSFGEHLSTLIISHRAKQRGIKATLLDSRAFIKTDDNFSCALPLFSLTDGLIKQHVKNRKGELIITQGFIASTRDGITTTLGRGGSDYTATIIGAALDAEEVQIWTDVSGIMTSDPRMVKKAKTIPQISYKEAAELAYFGARVMHPSTIQPAIDKKIPVIIKNTGQPKNPGTSIVPDIPERGLKAIASKVDITLINVTSSRMLLAYGFLKSIFQIFDKYKTPVDLVSTSEVSVSMTIDNPEMLDMIKADLENIGIVSIEPSMSIICLVGQELWKDSLFITRVFRVLKFIPIRMISLGSSDTNLSLVVPSVYTDDTVRRLHQEFFN